MKKHGEFSYVTEIPALQEIKTDISQAALLDFHQYVAERISTARQNEMKGHNQKTYIPAFKIHIGRLVLILQANQCGNKLSYKWIGPMRVFSTNAPHVFEIEDGILRRR